MPFYNFINSSNDTAVIEINGEIIETRPKHWWTGQPLDGLYFVSEEFNKQIDELKNKSKITLKINSPGGDLFVGIAVYNKLKQLSAQKEVIVEGIAASAAGLIACVGDTVKMGTGAVIMAHQASGVMWDNYVTQTDCEMKSKQLEACNKAVAEIISKKTGKTVDELLPLLKDEIWLTGQEAIDFGFADELLEGETEPQAPTYDPVNNTICSAGKVFAIKNIIENAEIHLSASQNKNVGQPTEKNKEEEPMSKETTITIEALKNDYPDIVKSIADEAVKNAIKAERERQKAIDEIAPVIADKEALSNAKYGDSGISAETLLYNAAKANAGKGADFFAAMVADYSASNVDKVETDPTGTETDDETKVENEIKSAVEFFNKTKEV